MSSLIAVTEWEGVMQMIISMCTVICMAGAILLLLRSESNHKRQLFAYIMLSWGMLYTIRTFAVLLGLMICMQIELFTPLVFLLGNLCFVVTLFYPLEIIRPGWFNLKYYISPSSLVIIIYYLIINLIKEKMIQSDGCIYCCIMHNIVVQLFLSYTFYKSFFNGDADMEGQFRIDMDETDDKVFTYEKAIEIQPYCQPMDVAIQKAKSVDDTAFQSKLPEYKARIEKWMVETKPYLRKDFQLMDVTEILMLNRTYLSQIFNEGWGTSFSKVVRDYRVRHAEELLKNYPVMTFSQVSILCGFTSLSVFYRAFTQCHNGMTPKQYRECN